MAIARSSAGSSKGVATDLWSLDISRYASWSRVCRPRRTRERLGAAVDISAVLDAKTEAMDTDRTHTPDLRMWMRVRSKAPELFRGELYIREFPDPHGGLETDLSRAR